MQVPTRRHRFLFKEENSRAVGAIAPSPPHNPKILLKSLYSIHQLPCLAKDLDNANLQKSINLLNLRCVIPTS
ncbi:MAG: hypothetical protein ACYT04_78775, partial [Nostoc sp.]